MNTDKRFQFMKDWSEYLAIPPTDDEIQDFSKQWNVKIDETLKLVEEAETKLNETKKKVVNRELDTK